MVENSDSFSKTKGSVIRRGLSQRQLRRLTSHIAENIDRRVSLRELANLVSLSRSYFCTAFRLSMDCTPNEWLLRERIAHAQSLLSGTSAPVTEVSMAVGYETCSAFSAAFRRHTGMTPSEYRRAS